MIDLKINGRSVQVEPGTTILQAASKLGIDIPTFCRDDRIPMKHCTEYGDCKMCSCTVTGSKSLLTACNTYVSEGMEVFTETEEVQAARKMILQQMLAKHPLDCLNCKKLGNCKLQRYCELYEVKEPDYIISVLHREKDESNRFYFQEMDKCIRCGKCVRTCRELVGVEALQMVQKGIHAEVRPITGESMADTACVSCGNCVSVCPVGALLPKSENDFRFWETKKVRTTCAYCGVGCQLDLIVKGDRVVDVQPAHGPSNEGLLCVKGRFSFDFINHKDRLTTPLIRTENGLEPASWEEALTLVADKIKEIKAEDGPDAIAGFASARTISEDNYLFQKFLRAAVGTNNVDHCARL